MKVLIIGLGSIAHKHIIALKEIDADVQFWALRSKKDAEDESGIISIYSLQELKEKLDFVIISNPTSLHKETIEKCISLNVPLFIEKPLASELEGLEELAKHCAEKKIITYVACNLRFHPVIKFLYEHLNTNKKRINEVNVYCGSYLPDWRPNKDFRTLYSANAEMGGGVHLDLIHEIDYCYYLFGKPEQSVQLQRATSSLQINATDAAYYHLIYNQFIANISLNYFRKDSKREIEIIFEDETWAADMINCKITNDNNEVIFQDNSYSVSDTYKAQLYYFIDCITQSKTPMNDMKEAIQTLKTVLNNKWAA